MSSLPSPFSFVIISFIQSFVRQPLTLYAFNTSSIGCSLQAPDRSNGSAVLFPRGFPTLNFIVLQRSSIVTARTKGEERSAAQIAQQMARTKCESGSALQIAQYEDTKLQKKGKRALKGQSGLLYTQLPYRPLAQPLARILVSNDSCCVYVTAVTSPLVWNTKRVSS